MRKRLINQVSPVDESWLDLQRLAQVELTSEDAAHSIEAALVPSAGSGVSGCSAGAHPRVCAAVVAGWRSIVPGDRASAI